MQPNSGARGEYAGLTVIKHYHQSRGDSDRNICIIPSSAHGTNPASAVVAGLKVIAVACDENGNVDLEDLKKKIDLYQKNIAAIMITYPSTHGVFEADINEIIKVVHGAGGQVYLDGANLNALVGHCSLKDLGVDVCHINLHKTFCIPHGGGGPGAGPIAVAQHLKDFLPKHPVVATGGPKGIEPVSAAPWGSALLYPISWSYIRTMGVEGLRLATETAILNANYLVKRLEGAYKVLYRGENGFVAHECIIDIRPLQKSAGIDCHDICKRLMDYGFHGPTVSWPVAGTLMIEPTESESKKEIDLYCDALLAIREEIKDIESGKVDKKNNLLKNAPHVMQDCIDEKWDRPYSRKEAFFPS